MVISLCLDCLHLITETHTTLLVGQIYYISLLLRVSAQSETRMLQGSLQVLAHCLQLPIV